MIKKKVVISCGPIPSRLDSVKFITNRFRGGLAFKTAKAIHDSGSYDLTVVVWKHTPLPEMPDGFWNREDVHVVRVLDVVDYCKWYEANAKDYDAFIMAAAVANLMPSQPWEGKFPSHLYKVGDKFDIGFEIAPRAIDIVKKVNPRACLIGYKLFDGSEDELIEAARLTQKESKANIVFANTPATAKEKKLAVMADNTVLPCTFDEHITLILRQIEARYYKTAVEPLSGSEMTDIEIREAFATVKLYEQTFSGFGTIAVPIPSMKGTFATTSRGHRGAPVLVRSVDEDNLIVHASGKATLNAPTLAAALNGRTGVIVVHRHDDDPLYNVSPCEYEFSTYLFPGTAEEAREVQIAVQDHGTGRMKLLGHGDITILPIENVDWNKYYEEFPERYFCLSPQLETVIEKNRGEESLELGCNKQTDAKYAYDLFVKANNAQDVDFPFIIGHHFSLVYARNAVNYMPPEFLRVVLAHTDKFVANTFFSAPIEKITDSESAVSSGSMVYHTLRLSNDRILRHLFRNYSSADYAEMGLTVTRYGKNSALVTKNISMDEL
ncbi:MAG: hypothetical protein IJS15_02575 [Victivallales bacterium]|nr:hypothetical protein [Victivallales bacterium]